MSRWEIRNNEDGSLDEVCGQGFVHLEQMDFGAWWLGLDAPRGEPRDHCRVWVSGRLGWPVWRDPEGAWWRSSSWEWIGWVRVYVTAEINS